MHEDDLVDLSRRGSVEAFNQLVLIYQSQVYNLALRVLGDAETAADAAQETFLSAFNAIGKYRGGSFKSWMMRIATNECYDQIRKRSRRRVSSLDAETEDDGELYLPASDRDIPENVFLRKEMSQALTAALGALPPDQRVVIAMSDVLGMSYQEISDAVGCSLGTVKSRLSRAREHVRGYIQANTELFDWVKRQ